DPPPPSVSLSRMGEGKGEGDSTPRPRAALRLMTQSHSIPTPTLSHPEEGVRAWWLSGLESALLFAIAAAYFSLGWSLTMEWMDQGQLLYPSWRVAEGAVPLRDFAQMYGPSTFYLLGWLLRAFGPDVLVVRIALIAVKALIAVIAYAITFRIASRP